MACYGAFITYYNAFIMLNGFIHKQTKVSDALYEHRYIERWLVMNHSLKCLIMGIVVRSHSML